MLLKRVMFLVLLSLFVLTARNALSEKTRKPSSFNPRKLNTKLPQKKPTKLQQAVKDNHDFYSKPPATYSNDYLLPIDISTNPQRWTSQTKPY